MDCSKEVAMGVGGVYDDRQSFVVGTSTLNQGGGFVFLVESAFVDKGDFLVSTDGVTNRYPILPVLFIHMVAQSLTMVNVAQASCHILTHEPGLALLVNHCPDFSELIVFENYYFFHIHFVLRRLLSGDL
jgi:hypothetical protein